jgi:hypothetical protein
VFGGWGAGRRPLLSVCWLEPAIEK